MRDGFGYRQRIAIAGTGISGLAAAWMLAPQFEIVVYESAGRAGGHSNTILAPGKKGAVPVDMGFIVYNEATYPNLKALFAHLDVPTTGTDMSFAASLGGGDLEYNGENLSALFGQKRNLVRPRFWSMLKDLVRFYRQAPGDLASLENSGLSLGVYLKLNRYGEAFVDDHLLPLAAAIWSSPAHSILDYPAASFIRFQENHGLLKLSGRPQWRTVTGGSKVYVNKMLERFASNVRLNTAVTQVSRLTNGVAVRDNHGGIEHFDHIIFATQADQAFAALSDPSTAETEILPQFTYSKNIAWLHRDEAWMPKRRSVWGSWNYMDRKPSDAQSLTVTYWMNRLQPIPRDDQLFVTLNPSTPPREELVIHREDYRHPVFDTAAIAAQRRLWLIQGQRHTWFCGSYFGAGFHEDGLQSGLAVAEQLGGIRRPWTLSNESSRIWLDPAIPQAGLIKDVA